MPPPPLNTTLELEQNIEKLESKFKSRLKESKPYADPEMLTLRHALCDNFFSVILLHKDQEDIQVQFLERLWRMCFHKVIDDFRKQIPKETLSSKKKQLTQDFKRFLTESSQFFEKLNRHLETTTQCRQCRSRIFCCLGDLARYREMISEFEEKRWSEAFDCYLASSLECSDSGFPQNQLAVLETYQNRMFQACYRYQRALACRMPFEAARGNLHQLLSKQHQQAKETMTTSPLETFLHSVLDLEASLLLVNTPTVESSKLDELLAEVRNRALPVFSQQVLKKDVSVALLLQAMYCAVHSPYRNTAKDLFHFVSVQFCLQACNDLTAKTDIKQSTKSLLYVCIVIDFLDQHDSAEWMSLLLRQSLERLQVLCGGGMDDSHRKDAEVGKFDEDEAELLGFLPLNLKPENQVVLEKDDVFAFRRRKVIRFVQRELQRELAPLAVNSTVFSLLNEEEEEELVFKPKFSNKLTTAAASVPMVSLPPLFSFDQIQSSAQIWQQQGGIPGASPLSSSSSRWAFAAATTTPQIPKPTAPTTTTVRRPPGF